MRMCYDNKSKKKKKFKGDRNNDDAQRSPYVELCSAFSSLNDFHILELLSKYWATV